VIGRLWGHGYHLYPGGRIEAMPYVLRDNQQVSFDQPIGSLFTIGK
jgi:hypothetical protein